MKKIHECENRNSADMDLAAGLTGEALGEIYAYKDDIWSEDLRQLGFYLGYCSETFRKDFRRIFAAV